MNTKYYLLKYFIKIFRMLSVIDNTLNKKVYSVSLTYPMLIFQNVSNILDGT